MIGFSRRTALAGIASAPLAASLLRLGQEARAETGLETVSVKTPSGRTVSGLLAVPAIVPAPAVLLIHGVSGVVDFIKQFASDFARDGFLALALDLYDGRTANDDTMRGYLSNEVYSDPKKATETITTWIAWLKADQRATGKVGVIGWSFGADWAMTASYTVPVDATVVYVALDYPQVEYLAQLKGPVLGQFAELDTSLSKSRVEMFEAKMKEAGKSAQVYWYPGNHYFPFPGREGYDKALADSAWTRTIEFLRANLR